MSLYCPYNLIFLNPYINPIIFKKRPYIFPGGNLKPCSYIVLLCGGWQQQPEDVYKEARSRSVLHCGKTRQVFENTREM